MVNIELYRIFIAIYRSGTISKAAVLCDITQPAASQQLASLEKILKVKLFERTPREMVATNEGHELYTKVADSFDWLDFVSQDFILQRDEEEAVLRIGVPLDFYIAVLIEKVLDLPFRLDIHFGTHEQLSAVLKSAKIDVMISDERMTNSTIYSEIVMPQKLLLVGYIDIKPPEQGFSKWQNIRAWVRKQNWISYDAELSLIRRCFKMQYDLQPNINPKFIIPNSHAMLKTLEQSKSVAILPDFLCKHYVDNNRVRILHTFEMHSDGQLYISHENTTKNNVLVKKFKDSIAGLKSDII